MMSAEYIQSLADEAGNKARRNRTQPRKFVNAGAMTPAQVCRQIPNLGSYRPSSWRLQENRMADASGMGAENESALTPRQLALWIAANPSDGFGIIEAGQFQVVIGRFAKV